MDNAPLIEARECEDVFRMRHGYRVLDKALGKLASESALLSHGLSKYNENQPVQGISLCSGAGLREGERGPGCWTWSACETRESCGLVLGLRVMENYYDKGCGEQRERSSSQARTRT
jgi:hypothetical protein